MRSERKNIGILGLAIVAAWFVTGLAINAKWSSLHGDEITRNLGMPASPMLMSAAMWAVGVYFAVVKAMFPVGPEEIGLAHRISMLGARLRSSIVADEDEFEDDEDCLPFDDMVDDRVGEPMHPNHWLGARVVALGAIAVIFMVSEGLDMVKPAVARPHAATTVHSASNAL